MLGCEFKQGYTADAFINLLRMNNSINYFASQLSPTVLNQLVSEVPSLASYFSFGVSSMSGTATFVKTGDNLVVTYNEGFADVPNYADYVNQIITGMIPTTYSSNTWSLLNDYALSSVVDTNLASLLAANQNQLSYDFTSSADLSSLRLQNGSYTIPVTIASDGNSFTKNVYLTLQGVQTETYIPSDPTVVNWISGISGLVAGTTMNIALVDSSSLSATQLSQIGNLNAIQIFSVSLNGPEQSGVISFSVPQSLVSNPSLVNLYVWDSSSNSWVELG